MDSVQETVVKKSYNKIPKIAYSAARKSELEIQKLLKQEEKRKEIEAKELLKVDAANSRAQKHQEAVKKAEEKRILLQQNQERIDEINRLIDEQYDELIERQLSDENLQDIFLQQSSSQENIRYFHNLFEKIIKNDELSDDRKIEMIINQLKLDDKIISHGTKGTIRGKTFNTIVQEKINSMELDSELFEVKFDTEYSDFSIKEKETGKEIVGINYLKNNLGKYIDSQQNKRKKVLCVIAKKENFSNITKIFQTYEKGLKNDTICFVRNLPNIINNFFGIIYKYIY